MNSPISVKPIDDGLDLEQPFDEREVRDSECLVYETKLRQPVRLPFRVAGAPRDMPTYIGFSLPILQPLNCNTDVDGQILHLSQGHFPDIAALEVDIEVHTHLPDFPLLLFFGKEGL